MSHHDPQLLAAHARASEHRAEIEASTVCGCFYCLATFEPSDIGEWVDAPKDPVTGAPTGEGETALCPHCGIDAVLGSQSGFPITPEFLTAMHGHWFG